MTQIGVDTVDDSKQALQIFHYHLGTFGGFKNVDISASYTLDNVPRAAAANILKFEDIEKYFDEKDCAMFEIVLKKSGFIPPTEYYMKVTNNSLVVAETEEDTSASGTEEDESDELDNHYLTFKDFNKTEISWKDVVNVLKVHPTHNSDPQGLLQRSIKKYRIAWIKEREDDEPIMVIDINYYDNCISRFMITIRNIERILSKDYVRVTIEYTVEHNGKTRYLWFLFTDEECAFAFQKDLNLLIG